MIRLLRRTYSTSSDEIFETLLHNITQRHGINNKNAIYKSLLDLREDHFTFQSHQVDLVTTKLGETSKSIEDLDPYYFAIKMIANGQKRASIISTSKHRTPIISHPFMSEVSSIIDKHNKSDQHEGIFFEIGRRSNALMAAFIWNSNRGQPVGGLHFQKYTSFGDFLMDGLTFSKITGRQAAISKLWCGGGAGMIAYPPGNINEPNRKKIFQDYGDFLSSLRGCYVASEGTGVHTPDLDTIFSKSRFVTNLSPEVGGAVNQHFIIAQGTVSAMEGALDSLELGTLENKKVVVQGMGSIGLPLISILLEKNVSQIICTDIQEKVVSEAKSKFKSKPVDIRLVQKNDASILEESCDILSINSSPRQITQEVISKIKSRIICGSSFQQLNHGVDEKIFKEMGITFIPDYIANALHLILGIDEIAGSFPNDPNILKYVKHFWEGSVYNNVKQVLQITKDYPNLTPMEAADRLADKFITMATSTNKGKYQNLISSLEDWHNRS